MLFVDGVNGILNISSVDGDRINGTIVRIPLNQTANATLNRGNVELCPKASPCLVAGSFDKQSGKVNFTSNPTIESLVKIGDTKYTGHLSSNVTGIDTINYWIIGTACHAGQGFGWLAHLVCPNGHCE